MNFGRFSFLATALLSLAACAGDDFDLNDPVDDTSSAVIRGEQDAIRGFTGAVRLNRPDGSGICSGVMITNNWVLTAKHCFAGENTVIVAYIDSPVTTTWVAQRIDHPSLDASLFRLATPFPSYTFGNPPTFTGYRRPLYSGTTESMQWQRLLCMGYGISNSDYVTPSDGQLRYAFLPVLGTETTGPQVTVTPNLAGPNGLERMWTGDSGGPCFWPQDGSLAAIDSYHLDIDFLQRGFMVSVPALRGWIQSIATF